MKAVPIPFVAPGFNGKGDLLESLQKGEDEIVCPAQGNLRTTVARARSFRFTAGKETLKRYCNRCKKCT